MTTIRRIFLLFLSAIMPCVANVPLYAAAVIPYGIVIEENLGVDDELMPMGATGCYVPGIGYVGTKAWRNCVSTVAQGGTILDFNGTIVTESVATMMIVEAGGTVVRIEDAHPAPDPHNYRHITYSINGTDHNTIQIQ